MRNCTLLVGGPFNSILFCVRLSSATEHHSFTWDLRPRCVCPELVTTKVVHSKGPLLMEPNVSQTCHFLSGKVFKSGKMRKSVLEPAHHSFRKVLYLLPFHDGKWNNSDIKKIWKVGFHVFPYIFIFIGTGWKISHKKGKFWLR